MKYPRLRRTGPAIPKGLPIRFWRLLLVLALLLTFVQPVSAQSRNLVKSINHWTKQGYFGFEIGFIGSGQLTADTIVYQTDPGFTFGVKFDFRLHGETFWGVTADIHRIHVRDTGQYLFDISLNLKRAFFSPASLVSFRPGIGIGYGYLAQFREYNSSNYLILKAGLEVLFFNTDQVAYCLELSFIGSPLASDGVSDYRLGITPIIRAGLLF